MVWIDVVAVLDHCVPGWPFSVIRAKENACRAQHTNLKCASVFRAVDAFAPAGLEKPLVGLKEDNECRSFIWHGPPPRMGGLLGRAP